MEKTITLDLTKAEVIMLQELAMYMDGGYEWKFNIAMNLREKALKAYQKPTLSQEEYNRRLESIREKWKGRAVEELMVSAEDDEIRFFYKVEESHVQRHHHISHGSSPGRGQALLCCIIDRP